MVDFSALINQLRTQNYSAKREILSLITTTFGMPNVPSEMYNMERNSVFFFSYVLVYNSLMVTCEMRSHYPIHDVSMLMNGKK